MVDYVSFAAQEYSQAAARQRDEVVKSHKWQDRLRELKIQRRAARRAPKLSASLNVRAPRSWS